MSGTPGAACFFVLIQDARALAEMAKRVRLPGCSEVKSVELYPGSCAHALNAHYLMKAVQANEERSGKDPQIGCPH